MSVPYIGLRKRDGPQEFVSWIPLFHIGKQIIQSKKVVTYRGGSFPFVISMCAVTYYNATLCVYRLQVLFVYRVVFHTTKSTVTNLSLI
jgi:hypothetical protein